MLNLALSQDLFLTIRTLKIQFRLKMFSSEFIAYCLLTNLAVTLKINLLMNFLIVMINVRIFFEMALKILARYLTVSTCRIKLEFSVLLR